MLRLNNRLRALLAGELRRQPNISVKKAVKQILENKGSSLKQPIRYQLDLIFKKLDSGKKNQKQQVLEFLRDKLALNVNDEMCGELLLTFSEAYDEESFMFDDDFALLNPELREYLTYIRNQYPEASLTKIVELAYKAGKKGSEELIHYDEDELKLLFLDSSIPIRADNQIHDKETLVLNK